MAEQKYDTLELVGLHEPDYSMELSPDGNKERADLPGTYSVGVVVGGRFMTLAHFKAGNLVDDKNKVKVGKSGSRKSEPAPADPDDGS